MFALICAMLAVSVDVEVRPLDGQFGSRDMSAGQLLVRNKHDAPFLLDGEPYIQPNAVEVYFKAYGEKGQTHTAGFFKVNGKAERVTVSSTDESVASIAYNQSLGFVATYKKAGSVHFVVSMMGTNLKLPCRVLVMPLRKGDSDARAIELLGIPTTKEKFYVGWPKTESVKGVLYSPRAGSPSHGEHWSYDKFPNAHLSIIDNKVHALGVYHEETRADFNALLASYSAWMETPAADPAHAKPVAAAAPKVDAEKERQQQQSAARATDESRKARAAAARSLLTLGKSFKARGDRASAERRFEKIVAEYPETPAAAEAKELLGPR